MFANVSAVQLGIVLLIVILIFGTRKLRNLGQDIGGGIQGIREGFGGDLGDAAEEIGRAKKSLEEFKEKVNDPSLGSSDGDDVFAPQGRSSGGRSSSQEESARSHTWPEEWDQWD